MTFSRTKLAVLAACASLFFSSSAQATLHLDITQPHVEPMPIALTDLISEDSNASQLGHDIIGVASADLERSGLFRPIASSAFIEKVTSGNAIPRFADWRQINAQGLVTAR